MKLARIFLSAILLLVLGVGGCRDRNDGNTTDSGSQQGSGAPSSTGGSSGGSQSSPSGTSGGSQSSPGSTGGSQ